MKTPDLIETLRASMEGLAARAAESSEPICLGCGEEWAAGPAHCPRCHGAVVPPAEAESYAYDVLTATAAIQRSTQAAQAATERLAGMEGGAA